jgi:asparagine synthase (glutamine-hydrolysing)
VGSVVAHLPAAGTPDTRTVEQMIAAAPHRGPVAATLVHGATALAISQTADRPDTSLASSNGVAVAVSGVVDNLAEVADQLAPAGMPPGSTPADVLVAAYRAFGDELPTRLRGFFSAIVSDGTRLLCFRDHLGFGTLFYRHAAGATHVATEAKQVVAGAGIPHEPDLAVLEQLFFQTYDDRTPCALRGVERLPKASIGLFERDGGRLRRYWDPGSLLETARYSEGELQERFDHLMARAVARTLTGEDIVSLSGGVDSPAVAAYAAPEHRSMTGRALPAVSLIFPDLPSVDELRYVELVARELGLELHTYEQTANPLDDLLEWVRLADGPVPAVALSQYREHYTFVRNLGLRTVLSGEVAEWVFDMSNYLVPHLVAHGRLGAVSRVLRARRARGASVKAMVRELASPVVPTRLTARRWAVRTSGVPGWLEPRRVNEAAVRSIVPAGRRWAKVQLGAFVVPGISMEADDICQELCGVRARRPFADVDLWEFFLSLPGEVKFPDTRSKTLARRLLRGRVPDAILDRTDKTLFDDSIMRRVDYPALRTWLIDPKERVGGVDYEMLRERLEDETLAISDFMWAKDLAGVHAFLSLW